MERLTKRSENNQVYVTESIDGQYGDEGYHGEAIEKLAKFENVYDHIIERQKAIPVELEALRSAGKEKNYKFKELLGQKIMNEMLLMQMSHQGLK
jgi:hypothetical protein